MLKKTMTYKTYDDEMVTEDFYFNLSRAELIELEVSTKDGFEDMLTKIIASEDGPRIMEIFKKILQMAVGRKSEDGKRFIKNDEVRDAFMQTEAYSDLFMELATDSAAAAQFVNGIMPSGLVNEDGKAVETVELPSATNETSTPVTPAEPTDEELLKMDPRKMTEAQLRRAFILKGTVA